MNRGKGYFGIGIWQHKHDCNVGTLFRSAYAFGADFLFTVGRPYKKQASDTPNAVKHIPYYNYVSTDDFLKHLPKDCRLVAVEITDEATPIENFVHPERAIYVLGSEAQTLPKRILDASLVVKINTKICLNVSTAGSIAIFHRKAQECEH